MCNRSSTGEIYVHTGALFSENRFLVYNLNCPLVRVATTCSVQHPKTTLPLCGVHHKNCTWFSQSYSQAIKHCSWLTALLSIYTCWVTACDKYVCMIHFRPNSNPHHYMTKMHEQGHHFSCICSLSYTRHSYSSGSGNLLTITLLNCTGKLFTTALVLDLLSGQIGAIRLQKGLKYWISSWLLW